MTVKSALEPTPKWKADAMQALKTEIEKAIRHVELASLPKSRLNQSKVARILGLSVPTLKKRMAEFGIVARKKGRAA